MNATTATAPKARRTKFTAICPASGEAFTRSSLRAYTFAAIYYETPATQRAKVERELRHAEKMTAKYDAISARIASGGALERGYEMFGAAEYAGFAENSRQHEARLIAKLNGEFSERRAATFHHTEALARKAASQLHGWDSATIVPCTAK